ncbi:fungal-specific transcription factor domain-containing protein [Fennellomyces sp. T-0311]|nr:fungal-specific transcription factor domain-containing protein [Fennellomyces sp. T-0311]
MTWIQLHLLMCDGLRPCMQCKARNRPCTFYKDGSFDPDQETPDDTATLPPHPDNPSSSLSSGPDQYTLNSLENTSESCYLFADTKDGNATRSKRRGPPLESRTSNTLASLGDGLRKVSLYDKHSGKTFTDAEPFGSFIKWIPEPPLPSRYTGSIEMPSREAQMEMIELFFRENYEVMPIIPRRYFFDQLRCKGPFITPLLLNAIYAQTSRFSDNPELPKPEVFFHRAKRLLDDFMDAPRVSTVVALCYMSLYEPSPSTHRGGSPFCRAWMYSGMSYRMCLELGLHNQSNISKELSKDEIELRKRVYWSCYCLDKVQSGGWERPWMLTTRFSSVDLPAVLPDDDGDESLILENLRQKIKFAQLCEEALMFSTEQQITTSEKDKVEGLQNRFSEFVRSLPPELQWTPTSTLSVDDVMRLPASRPMVMHLHLIFNQCILDQLFRAPNNAYNQFQRRIMATCITQLVNFICERPASVVKYDLLVHSLLSAIKVHVRHLYSSDISIARQSWAMFDRSVMAIHKLRRYASIPNSAKFLQQLGSSVDGYEIPEEAIASVASATAQPPLEQQQHYNTRQPVLTPPSASASASIIPVAHNDMTNQTDDILNRIYLGQQQRTHPAFPPATAAMPPPSSEDNSEYVVLSMGQQHQPQHQPHHHQHHQQQQQDWAAAAAVSSAAPILQSSSSSPTSQAAVHTSLMMNPTAPTGLVSPSMASARKVNAEHFIQLQNPHEMMMGKFASPTNPGVLYSNAAPDASPASEQQPLWHYQD